MDIILIYYITFIRFLLVKSQNSVFTQKCSKRQNKFSTYGEIPLKLSLVFHAGRRSLENLLITHLNQFNSERI
jgi:hypothetical protein